MSDEIWITAAKRTVQGRFLGGLSGYSSVDLAVAAGEAALTGIDKATVDQVIVGNVLSAGQGMNVGRQVGVKLGLPRETPGFSVNMMCASGLQAVALGAQAIRAGDAGVVLCGGTESMSNAPYLLERARSGYKLGDGRLVDSLLRDGLVDSFTSEHMGVTAERLARSFGLSREAQDVYAARSHRRYAEAVKAGRFDDERVPLGECLTDEHPRPETTEGDLARLKATFRDDGTVTPGNASGINDGAAMIVLCGEKAGRRYGWEPMVRVAAWVSEGCDPERMGLGPVYAVRKLCAKEGTAVADYDMIELNEAFGAQALACSKELGLDPDDPRVNRDGGAIALGHPIGASGARLITHLAHRMARDRKIRRGLAALCVGGGMGVAMALESVGQPGG